MKRIALLAIVGAALLAPSSASAQAPPPACQDGSEVSPGNPGYFCVYVEGPAQTGGQDIGGEAVFNSAGCSYINAWTTNPGTPGYAGICTQTKTTDPGTTGCNGIDEGSGPNEGGCFWIKPAPDDVNNAINSAPPGFAVTAMFICGNTSGEDPKNSTRDGCSIP